MVNLQQRTNVSKLNTWLLPHELPYGQVNGLNLEFTVECIITTRLISPHCKAEIQNAAFFLADEAGTGQSHKDGDSNTQLSLITFILTFFSYQPGLLLVDYFLISLIVSLIKIYLTCVSVSCWRLSVSMVV